MRKHFALLALVVILGLVNWSIVARERHLAEGKVVYLQLAPVDPRSLMQGDYMTLRFAVADRIHAALSQSDQGPGWRADLEASDGYVVVAVDERRLGTFKRLDEGGPLAGDEVRMRYRVRSGQVRFATNAYFFEEGRGEAFAGARLGEFRVDAEGELLLVGLKES